MPTASLRYHILAIILLTALTVPVYWQVAEHDFINYDDYAYVVKNPNVTGGLTLSGITWAFTSVHSANWHPVTWISHMADVEIYGMNPRGHHLTNVFIHTGSTILLFLLLSYLTASPWRSCFVALLFAVHPLHVESVAWVAERKDVLSAFFCFLTLLLYARYVRKRQISTYCAALAAFVLGLMAKPMLVTLPVVMLLVDYWPLGRYAAATTPSSTPPLKLFLRLCREKFPFLACSLLSSIITLLAQKGAIQDVGTLPLWPRVANALSSYLKYIGKMFWPTDLSIYYPFSLTIPLWQTVAALAALVAVTATVILARDRHPYFVTGWFWYLVTLLPVIGIIQVGAQAMADRYTYIPLTGLFIIGTWGVAEAAGSLRQRGLILAMLATGIALLLIVQTNNYLKNWPNSITLFTHALKVTENNALAHNNLGSAYSEKGLIQEAIEEYRKSIEINPKYVDAYYNLANGLMRTNQIEEAIEFYLKAIEINPVYSKAHINLGVAHARMGAHDQAVILYGRALELEPGNSLLHNNMGFSLYQQGLIDQAIEEYRRALSLNSKYLNARINLGNALTKAGRDEEAIEAYRTTTEIDPGNYEAYTQWGVVLLKNGRPAEAAGLFSKALEIKPDYADAVDNLKLASSDQTGHR